MRNLRSMENEKWLMGLLRIQMVLVEAQRPVILSTFSPWPPEQN